MEILLFKFALEEFIILLKNIVILYYSKTLFYSEK